MFESLESVLEPRDSLCRPSTTCSRGRGLIRSSSCSRTAGGWTRTASRTSLRRTLALFPAVGSRLVAARRTTRTASSPPTTAAPSRSRRRRRAFADASDARTPSSTPVETVPGQPLARVRLTRHPGRLGPRGEPVPRGRGRLQLLLLPLRLVAGVPRARRPAALARPRAAPARPRDGVSGARPAGVPRDGRAGRLRAVPRRTAARRSRATGCAGRGGCSREPSCARSSRRPSPSARCGSPTTTWWRRGCGARTCRSWADAARAPGLPQLPGRPAPGAARLPPDVLRLRGRPRQRHDRARAPGRGAPSPTSRGASATPWPASTRRARGGRSAAIDRLPAPGGPGGPRAAARRAPARRPPRHQPLAPPVREIVFDAGPPVAFDILAPAERCAVVLPAEDGLDVRICLPVA